MSNARRKGDVSRWNVSTSRFWGKRVLTGLATKLRPRLRYTCVPSRANGVTPREYDVTSLITPSCAITRNQGGILFFFLVRHDVAGVPEG